MTSDAIMNFRLLTCMLKSIWKSILSVSFFKQSQADKINRALYSKRI